MPLQGTDKKGTYEIGDLPDEPKPATLDELKRLLTRALERLDLVEAKLNHVDHRQIAHKVDLHHLAVDYTQHLTTHHGCG